MEPFCKNKDTENECTFCTKMVPLATWHLLPPYNLSFLIFNVNQILSFSSYNNKMNII